MQRINIPKEQITFSDLLLTGGLSTLSIAIISIIFIIFKKNTDGDFLVGVLLTSLTVSLLFRKNHGDIFSIKSSLKYITLQSIIFSILLYVVVFIEEDRDVLSDLIFIPAFFSIIFIITLIIGSFLLFVNQYRSIYITNDVRFKKIILVIGIILNTLVFLYDFDILIPKSDKEWDHIHPVNWEDFRAHRFLTSSYDAGISSDFEYEIFGEIDSIKVVSLMKRHESWCYPDTLNELESLLKHEQYHFNLTEAVARKFKKSLSEISADNISKEKIHDLYLKYQKNLNELQDLYDKESRHSLDIERQLDWEYLIDSLLYSYSFYGTSIIKFKSIEHVQKTGCFRFIVFNDKNEIEGRCYVDSSFADSIKHYKLKFDNSNRLTKLEFWDRKAKAIDDVFNAFRVIWSYSKDTTWEYYYDIKDNKKTVNGIFAKSWYRKGNIVECSYFDSVLVKTENKNGYHKIVYNLNEEEQFYKSAFYDLGNVRVCNENGYYSCLNEYDKFGNRTKVSNLDSLGQLTSLKDGSAYSISRFNRNNQKIHTEVFDKYGNLWPINDISSFNYTWDYNGYLTSQYYLTPEGDYFLMQNKIAINFYKRDRYGNSIENLRYGINKNLVTDKNGMCHTILKFDNYGNIVDLENFDAYGNMINANDKICKYTIIKNDKGQHTEEKYFSMISDSIVVIKTKRFYYDSLDRNNIIENIFFDSSKTNYKLKLEFDNKGKTIKEIYLNSEGKIIACDGRIAITKRIYAEGTNCITVSYFDEFDNPTTDNDDIHKIIFERDNENRIRKKSFYDINDKPICDKNGRFAFENKYDRKGNLISQYLYDANGEKGVNSHGMHRKEILYDSLNNIISEKVYGLNGNLVSISKDYAYSEITFPYGKKIKWISFYSTENKLIKNKSGYAKECLVYDKYGLLLEQSYWDENKKPVRSEGYHKLVYERDCFGNIIKYHYYDENGNKFIISEDSRFAGKFFYDRNGKEVNRITNDDDLILNPPKGYIDCYCSPNRKLLDIEF